MHQKGLFFFFYHYITHHGITGNITVSGEVQHRAVLFCINTGVMLYSVATGKYSFVISGLHILRCSVEDERSQ